MHDWNINETISKNKIKGFIKGEEIVPNRKIWGGYCDKNHKLIYQANQTNHNP